MLRCNKKRIQCIFAVSVSVVISILLFMLVPFDTPDEESEKDYAEVSSFAAGEAYNDIGVDASETFGAEKEGFGLYIDDIFIAACEDAGEIEESVDTVLDMYSKEVSGECLESDFVNDVRIVGGQYSEDDFVDGDEMVSLLGVDSPELLTYSVSTAAGEETDISLSVRSVVVQTEETVIPCETVAVYNSEREKGYEKVLEEGSDGVTVTEYKAVFINGEYTSRTLMSVSAVSEPVDRKVEYGTYVRTAVFAWPYKGYITSYFGGRTLGGAYDFHNGIDIVSNGGVTYGQPIKAALDGVVTVARYYDAGGYGKYVVIRHDNGMETYYAHMSEVLVNVGDRVSLGDVIGKIGSTGYSTGPHLHFGVKVNGQMVNPLKYLD